MKTSAILSQANVTLNLGAGKQADSASAEMPFKQVLSRETDKANNAREASNPAPQAQVQQSPVNGKAKAPDAGNAKETAPASPEDSDTAQDAASTEMLALVANLIQAVPAASDGAASDAAVAALPSADAGKSAAAGGLAASDLLGQLKAASTQESQDKALPADLDGDAQFQAKLQAAASGDKPALQAQAATFTAAEPSAKQSASLAALAAQDKTQTAAGAALTDGASGKLAAKDAVPKAVADVTPNRNTEASQLPAPTASVQTADKESALPSLDLNAAKVQEAPAPAPAMVGQLQQATLAANQALASNPVEKLAPQVGSPGWDQALGQKVVWMVAGGQQSASLTLNPPDLGPLQVVLNVSNSQATANFTAAQPEVRQALEAAMPKLREMLADTGIQLGQTTVSTGMPNQYSGAGDQAAQNQRHSSPAAVTADIPVPVTRPVVSSSGVGLVDTFA